MAEESYSGRIWPLPPRQDLKVSEITFGLCVDVFINDSWRDGVLVAEKPDYGKILVFFPDSNDEVLALTSQIHPSQEWNELSGRWTRRGIWFFVQIIKKFLPKEIVMSEIKSMWFHLKDTDNFCKEIKNWYSGPKLMWTVLVFDMIQESFPLIFASHTCKNFCTTSKQLREVKNVYRRRMIHREPHILDSGEKFTEMMEADGGREDEKFENNEGDNKSVLSSYSDNRFLLEDKEDEKNIVSRAWKPVELEGEYCHDLSEWCFSHAEFKMDLMKKIKLRKHLVSIGWRIESNERDIVRFRYISPERRIYYSLKLVFQNLLKEMSKMSGKIRDKDNSKDIDLDNLLSEFSPAKSDFVSLNNDQIMHPFQPRPFATQKTAELPCTESDSSVLMDCKVIQSNSSEIIEENALVATLKSDKAVKYEDNNEFCVIKAYVEHMKMLKGKAKLSSVDVKELRSRTRDFLLEKGWKFWLYDKKVRQELRYTSPNRKTYLSLYTACVGFLREVNHENIRKMEYQKSHVLQKEGLERGPFSSPTLFDFDGFDSKEHMGRKRDLKKRKKEYSNVHVALDKHLKIQLNGNYFSDQNISVKMKQKPLSSSKLFDFGELNSKKHLGGNRERKRRKIVHSNNLVTLDDQLQYNYYDQQHDVKIDVFRSSKSYKSSRKKFTSRVLRSGKRSRWAIVLSSNDQVAKTILSWLIDKDVVLLRQKVSFVRKIDGHTMKEGWITHEGIKCRCCLNVFSLSQFGAHAGSITSQPSVSIMLQDGRSLLDCQKQVLSAFKPRKFQHTRLKRDYSNLEADEICTVCQDGGMILLCDLCPSVFHLACIGLEDVPEGQWFCPSCRCGLCGFSEFNCDTDSFTHNSGIYCDQCERQYHVGCLQKQGLQLNECPTGTWTCSESCSKIISRLRLLLGKSNPIQGNGLHWTILRSNIEDVGKLDDESIVENSGLLHLALDVLHECFETMVETRTQSDVASDVIFNNTSELNRLNFRGFYTMLLMCGDELISVATFRIFGEKLAEMPFIGTRVKFRRQGMCCILMNELQKLLASLGVERLLLPAVPELLKTWTSSFGFTKITPSDRLELLEHKLLTFQGTTLCQKLLKKPSA
ncbi:uncharacterized protein LOC110023627 [Phalaenopsis equestris]|uniref:uncharacterized protein LOC110023627 n=1 Tax=Phalaenopsis equestris TaxID=78828 RepID=UPI0009E3A236|nr:uncharacterized protein LOC110023627 [Phalaenopsis equestris]